MSGGGWQSRNSGGTGRQPQSDRDLEAELRRMRTRLDAIEAALAAPGGSSFTAEDAQDAVGAALTATAEVVPTYNDGANQMTWAIGAIAQAKISGLVAALAAKAVRIQHQRLTSNGTYSPTANLLYCMVIFTGVGGGGGGADATADGDAGAGGGGGAGETRIGIFDVATIGAGVTVTFGTPGAAGSNTGGNGGNGGSSTFGALLTAAGGQGGLGSGTSADGGDGNQGGTGGTGGSGGFGWDGGDGGAGGGTSATTGSFGNGGTGGSSFWGGGGRGGAGGTTNGTTDITGAGANGKALGSGGGGAICVNATAGAAGGVGASGCCWVLELIA